MLGCLEAPSKVGKSWAVTLERSYRYFLAEFSKLAIPKKNWYAEFGQFVFNEFKKAERSRHETAKMLSNMWKSGE